MCVCAHICACVSATTSSSTCRSSRRHRAVSSIALAASKLQPVMHLLTRVRTYAPTNIAHARRASARANALFLASIRAQARPTPAHPAKFLPKNRPQASTPSHIRQPTSAFVSALALTRAISDVAAPGRACPCRRRCGGCSRTGAGPRRGSWGRGPTETT